jgi:hypothetical protein
MFAHRADAEEEREKRSMSIQLMRRMACVVGTTALSVGLVGTASGSVVILDNFAETETKDNENWTLHLSEAGSQEIQTESLTNIAGSVLGANRQTTITAVSIGVEGLDFLRGTLAPSPGIFDYNSTAAAKGHVSFLYAGGSGNLNEDLSAFNRIEIGFIMFDFANEQSLPVTITMTDNSSNEATRTVSLANTDPTTMVFNFADFSGIGNLDLTSIRTIQVDFDPAVGADFRLGQMMIVPAPGVFALLGLAGLVIAPQRRRNV